MHACITWSDTTTSGWFNKMTDILFLAYFGHLQTQNGSPRVRHFKEKNGGPDVGHF